MILQPTFLLLIVIIILFTFSSSKAQRHNSPPGQSFCFNSSISVQYPFGFSAGHGIRLNCSSNGEIKVGNFVVQNITPSSIFVNLPAKCNRSINSIATLFGKNYGLSWQNSLLLQGCGTSLNDCVIPTSFVEKRFNLSRCDGNKNTTISCFSQDFDKLDILNFTDVKMKVKRCKFLLGSIAFDSSDSSDSPDSLELQRLELKWWLDGTCNCHSNATCKTLKLPGDILGYRCQCNDGFHGDGFKKGLGCRKVSECDSSKYLFTECGGITKVGVLVGGILAGATIMAGIIFLYYFVRHRSHCLKNHMSAKRLLNEAAGNSSVALYPYREIERATNGFSEKQMLGTGAFGTVYAGKLHNDEYVAIKKIKYRDTSSIDQVMNEIKLVSSVSHPNLVRLLGCCIEEGEQILVYEYMPNGTLSQHLQRERGTGLPWTIRLTIASETANAIAYLHSAMNPPIYHRDVKSSNILLDYNFNSKVADFGLSRLGMIESSHISTAPQGTPGYVDPQYHQNFHLSDKSDVYSFGVVLVEIITALKVVDFTRPQCEINLAALAIDKIGMGCMDEIIDPFLEPHRDAWMLYSINKVAELAFRCLAFHSDMRPSMMEVAEELELIKQSGWASMEENNGFVSSMVSTCSSPYNGSEKSFTSMKSKKFGIGRQRSIVPQRLDDSLAIMDEEKDSSPISVQDPWLSEQSSPSTNSLLGSVIQ